MAYTSIDNPELYFQVKTYSGNGGTQSVTLDGSENMQPDWVWIKNRGATASHILTDVIRGVTKNVFSDKTETEETISTRITSFDSDGFSLGSEANVNASSNTYVSWNWKAGGSASSNSDGTGITSSVSANTTAGFSIVSYTGSGTTSNTVGHGLSSIDWLIVKSRDEADSWFVKHKSLSSNHNLNLNQTVAQTNVTSAYSEGGLSNLSGNTFGFLDGTSDANAVNESGEKHIAYCFKEVKGYSKFGSYTGNGSTDGTFIYTGFKPAYVLIKKTSGTAQWKILDNKRDTFNVVDALINASNNGSESTFTTLDFLSNGFKMRNSDADMNGSGASYIYMAFAESPFVNSKGIPTNAR